MLRTCFFSAKGTRQLMSIKERINGTMYCKILGRSPQQFWGFGVVAWQHRLSTPYLLSTGRRSKAVEARLSQTGTLKSYSGSHSCPGMCLSSCCKIQFHFQCSHCWKEVFAHHYRLSHYFRGVIWQNQWRPNTCLPYWNCPEEAVHRLPSTDGHPPIVLQSFRKITQPGWCVYSH